MCTCHHSELPQNLLAHGHPNYPPKTPMPSRDLPRQKKPDHHALEQVQTGVQQQ
jgi:hypothetical protein